MTATQLGEAIRSAAMTIERNATKHHLDATANVDEAVRVSGFCKRGHEISKHSSTYSNGKRQCNACKAITDKARYQAKQGLK
mgnify:CR=1 FL=1